MKKIILAAAAVLSIGILSTSHIKQNGAKPEAYYVANPINDRKDIGSAD